MDKDFKDYVDSKGDVLLQLLVFEHATGDVTVQGEVGEIEARFGNIGYQIKAGHLQYKTCPFELMREAIDKAVAEQYGRRPKPPYIEKREFDYVLVWADSDHGRVLLGGNGSMDALNYIANKELPVVDASESQVKSEWAKVFPPTTNILNEIMEPSAATTEMRYRYVIADMQNETAFTVWRLKVTR